jgi:hypothetical protein
MKLSRTSSVHIIINAVFALVQFLYAQTSDTSIELLDLPNVPSVFLPGIVSTQADEYGLAVSMDWSEIYFTRIDGDISSILMAKRNKSSWGIPNITSFSRPGGAAHPWLSVDETKIYFVSRRPCIGAKQALNVWMSKRSYGEWEEPIALGKPFTNETVHAPSVSASGNLYASGLKCFRKTDEGYLDSEKLSPEIHGSHPAVSSDEKFIVFSARRPGGHGGNDLYVVFKRVNGKWGEPINLGLKVNTNLVESSPTLSSDGRVLFFSRNGDIWWVNSDVVQRLDPSINK